MSQTPQNHMEIRNVFDDSVTYLPSFTCVHCNRAVIQNPARTRARNVCRNCDALTCDACAGGCNPILRDAEKALVDHLGQPWLLRGLRADGRDAGEPVLVVDGQLALAKDVGYTERALARQRRD